MPWQITGYLPHEEAKRFLEYASSLGVDKSSLAVLLIQRELARGRLPSLLRFKHSHAVSECTKVTAHVYREQIRSGFSATAKRHRLRLGAAATILFRAELEERWLEKAISQSDSD